MAWNQLAAELWTKIADECDKNGVRALCSPEMPPHIRDSARPVHFRHLSFRSYNLTDKLDLSNFERFQYARILAENQCFSYERFTKLPRSPLVRHVRSWRYIGHLVGPLDANIMSSEDKMFIRIMRTYLGGLWPPFLANLYLYVGLTTLALDNVDIDDVAVTSLNTLDNLRTLEIIWSSLSCTTNFLRPFAHLTRYTQQEDSHNFRVEFMMAVCFTLTYLDVVVCKDDYRRLYSALEQCHVLETLSIDMCDGEEERFERPPEDLSITACPKLSKYIGSAYYAANIIPGRPVHTMKLVQTPYHAEEHSECVEWIREVFTRGTVPVEHFDVNLWPAYACAEEIFPTLFHEFSRLVSLRIIIEPSVRTGEVDFRDELERERFNTCHYLNMLHILSGPLPYKIPPTLRTLELVTEDVYERHSTHNFDAVLTALTRSAQFANLQTLTVGIEPCSQTWRRSESGIWDIVQEGEGFDFDGEGGGVPQ